MYDSYVQAVDGRSFQTMGIIIVKSLDFYTGIAQNWKVWIGTGWCFNKCVFMPQPWKAGRKTDDESADRDFGGEGGRKDFIKTVAVRSVTRVIYWINLLCQCWGRRKFNSWNKEVCCQGRYCFCWNWKRHNIPVLVVTFVSPQQSGTPGWWSSGSLWDLVLDLCVLQILASAQGGWDSCLSQRAYKGIWIVVVGGFCLGNLWWKHWERFTMLLLLG
jgi:hypothetical protein